MQSSSIPIRKSVLRAFAAPALVALSLLAACGGSDDAATSSAAGAGAGSKRALAAPTPSQIDAAFGLRAGVIAPAAAVRLLNQATFGATIDDLADLRSGTPEQWLERQFAMTRATAYASLVDDVLAAPLDPARIYGADSPERNVNMIWRPYIEDGSNQLRRRVGAALAEIFVINARVGTIGLKNNIPATVAFMDRLEGRAFGNFRSILESVTRAPAMGVFLSYLNNQKALYDADGQAIRVPDENYAREIMQLFSIGLYQLNLNGTLKLDANGKPIPTYRQADVANLARVFTGLVLDTSTASNKYVPSMVVDEAVHSPEAAVFLGTTVAAGTPTLKAIDQAIDTLFNHPNVGPFIGRQLIQRLVTSNPSPQYVRRVALAFNDNGQGVRGDMKAVIRAILLDPEARDPQSRTDLLDIQGKLREPMFRLTAVARLLGASSQQTVFPVGDLSNAFTGIGQSPLKSPSVFNFFRPGYTPPNTPIAERGLVAPEFQILDGSSIASGINVINEFIDRAPEFLDVETSYLTSLAPDAAALVDHVALMLTAATLDATSRDEFVSIVAAVPAESRWDRVRTAVALVASSPAFLVQK